MVPQSRLSIAYATKLRVGRLYTNSTEYLHKEVHGMRLRHRLLPKNERLSKCGSCECAKFGNDRNIILKHVNRERKQLSFVNSMFPPSICTIASTITQYSVDLVLAQCPRICGIV